MNIQRVLTKVTIEVTRSHQGYLVQATRKQCESTIGAGRMVEDVDRYDCLSIEECRQVLDDIVVGQMPGETMDEQYSLFV